MIDVFAKKTSIIEIFLFLSVNPHCPILWRCCHVLRWYHGLCWCQVLVFLLTTQFRFLSQSPSSLVLDTVSDSLCRDVL